MEALNAHPVNPPWVSCGSCFDPYMLYLILHHYTLELHVYKFLSLIILLSFRQLEAIIRISESLAKMRLLPFATAAHVEEALRLFQVSTLDAAMSGSLSGNIKIFYLSGHQFKIALEAESKAHGHIISCSFNPWQPLLHSGHCRGLTNEGITCCLVG